MTSVRLRGADRRACFALVLSLGLASAGTAQRRVVLLYDERTDLPGLAALDARLATTLTAGSPGGIEIYREAMELSRFPSDRHRLLLSSYLRAKYAGKPIDVVIPVLGPALDFALAHGREMFPGAAIVFCGIDRREFDARRLPANVTGVILKRTFAPTLELALRLHPGTQRVLLVAGSSAFDRRLVEAAEAEFAAARPERTIEYLIGLPLPNLLDTLARLPPRTIVLFSTMFSDRAGRSYVPHEVVAKIADTATAPVYAFVDQYLGRGIVGGHLYSLDIHAEEAGRLALRVLAGTPPSAVPPLERLASADMFDWRQLRRWGIDEHALPAGAIVRFREIGPWERYRTTILITAGVLLLQSALIVALLLERRRRRRSQLALQHSEARAQDAGVALEQTRGQVEHMARVATVSGLAAAVSHELRQPLTAIRMNAAAGALFLARNPPDLDEARQAFLEIVRDDARAAEVIDHFRILLRKQDPVSTTVDLNAVCRDTAKLVEPEVSARGARLALQLDPAIPPVRGDPVQLQQVIINLTLNALDALSASPAPPDRVATISTGASNGTVEVHVSDSGPGLPPDVQRRLFEPFFSTKPKDRGLGLGLAIVHGIVADLEGRVVVESAEGRGTTFTVFVPRAHAATAEAGPAA